MMPDRLRHHWDSDLGKGRLSTGSGRANSEFMLKRRCRATTLGHPC
jgi:hypothetical protein